MTNHDCVYGLIIEYKNEGPLIMEGKPMDYEVVYERMRVAMQASNVIRVAIFKAVYETGNERILEIKGE